MVVLEPRGTGLVQNRGEGERRKKERVSRCLRFRRVSSPSFSNSPLLSRSNRFVGNTESIGNLLSVVEDGVGDGSLEEEERDAF